MTGLNVNIRAVFLLLAFAVAPAGAQQYRGGAHRLESPQGELVINSGFVNNLNVHTFHVYSFLFKPSDPGSGWQQVPVVEQDIGSDMKFTVTTANTADFTLRDARVVVVDGAAELQIAQKIFRHSPYDDNATVQLRRYVLQQTEDEERWVFQYASSSSVGRGVTVEEALNPQRKPRAKAE